MRRKATLHQVSSALQVSSRLLPQHVPFRRLNTTRRDEGQIVLTASENQPECQCAGTGRYADNRRFVPASREYCNGPCSIRPPKHQPPDDKTCAKSGNLVVFC